MQKAFSIVPVIFGIFSFVVIILIVLLLGREAVNKKIIDITQDVKPADKLTAIEAAHKAAQTHKIYANSGWSNLELDHSEWNSEDSDLEIRYLAPTKGPTLFFVIVHPKDKLAGIPITVYKRSMALALGGYGDSLPSPPKGNFLTGERILSGFGIIHVLTNDKDGFVKVEPPIVQSELERNFLLVDDLNANIETFNFDENSK